MSKVVPVLLAGGRGRLWPASRKAFPKQFSNLLEGKSLFQNSYAIEGIDIPQIQSPIIMTNDDFRFIVLDQLKEINALAGSIVLEPEGKNTAASILAATLLAVDDDAVILVLPTDHKIQGSELFNEAIIRGIQCVNEANLVTFGVTPTHPETGFGYMRVNDRHRACKVIEFLEKPNLKLVKFLESEEYLWNSGIFTFKHLYAGLLQHKPVLVEQAIKRAPFLI